MYTCNYVNSLWFQIETKRALTKQQQQEQAASKGLTGILLFN